MRQRTKRFDGLRESLARLLGLVRAVCRHHRQRRGKRIGDVVLAEQRKVGARDERGAKESQLAGLGIDPSVGFLEQREFELVAGDVLDHAHHCLIVAIHNPGGFSVCVGEEARLVRVILVRARVTIQMVGAQIGKDADNRLEAGRVVQLKRRHLQRNPLRLLLSNCDLRKRRPDVTGLHCFQIETAQQMRDECGRRGLAVGAGDGDDARAFEKVERDLHLARDRNSMLAGKCERLGARREPGAGHQEPGVRQASEIVASDVDGDSLSAQLFRAAARLRRRGDVRRVDVVAVLSEKQRHCAAAASETDDGDLTLARHQVAWGHRSLSVLSPMNAASTPMIQKRTTTCASSQPLTSKWWCSGARLKTRCSRAYSIPYRRFLYLNTKRCRITDTISATNTPPTSSNRNSDLSRIETAASAPPSASEPVSPMKTSAGWVLYQRNPMHAPSSAAQKTVSSPEPRRK